MTKEQVRLIQASWRDIVLVADSASAMFYSRLFAIDPEAGALFAAADMRKQREKLVLTLNEIVSSLDDPDRVFESLDELGRRHRAYGVKAHHYDTVGEALLWMLEKVLANEFAPPVRAAWVAAYALISERMQTA